MAKSVKELISRTMGAADSAPPSSQTFPPLDVEQIARMLRLDERAENAGRARLPAADAGGPDVVELEVLGVIEEASRKANEDYLAQRDFYEGRIRRAAITPDLKVQLEAAGANALADFRAEIIHDQNTLHTLLQAAGNREAEYQEFRQRHNLNRLPRNISQGQRTFAFMVLAVFVVVESILNGMFFAEGSEAGIVGGVMQALVLSILNVGVATLYAVYGLPFLCHRRMWGKTVGVLATAAFAFWLLGLNLVIGHYRDLFIAGEGTVQMVELLNRLTTTPLLLGDAKSGLLVLLGIALGLLSVIDVAASRDPYPGYGAIGRERQRAIERYAHENAKSLAAIMRLRDQTVDDMTAAIELMRSAQFDMQQAIEGRARLHHNYRAYLEHLAVVHERLIQRYRDGNRRVRRGDVPPYFRQPPSRPAFVDPPVMAQMPGMELDVRPEVIAQIDEDIKAVNHKFEHTVPEYQTVGQLASIGGSVIAAS